MPFTQTTTRKSNIRPGLIPVTGQVNSKDTLFTQDPATPTKAQKPKKAKAIFIKLGPCNRMSITSEVLYEFNITEEYKSAEFFYNHDTNEIAISFSKQAIRTARSSSRYLVKASRTKTIRKDKITPSTMYLAIGKFLKHYGIAATGFVTYHPVRSPLHGELPERCTKAVIIKVGDLNARAMMEKDFGQPYLDEVRLSKMLAAEANSKRSGS